MKQAGRHLAVLNAAMRLHKEGHLDAALDCYRRALDAAPDDVDVLHYLGVCTHQCGQGVQALAYIRRALSLAPEYTDAHNNLGNVLLEQGDPGNALRAYRRVIELCPDHADAHNNLGVALRGLGRYEESVAAYRAAVALDPGYATAFLNLGNVLARMDRLDDAVAAYLKALELRPHDPAAYDAMGKTLYRAGRAEEAVVVFRRWLEADPGSPIARHMLAACTQTDAPDRASDGYVSQVFDDFARSFDQVLARLEYAAPGLLAQSIESHLPAERALDVLDAGCGTGLCAGFLAPRARRLVGVDLSRGMLAKAATLRRYDELVHAELTRFMSRRSGEFDLIVSADTLVYFGKLDAVFRAARGAMRAGAFLAFTVELATPIDAPAGYVLTPTGRYAHTRDYVTSELASASLAALALEQAVLRKEGGTEVNGLVVAARREGV